MFNRIRASLLWAEMLKRRANGDYVAAAKSADKYRNLAFNNAAFRALDATIDILNHKMEDSLKKFRELSLYLQNIEGIDAAYINMYCKYYICLIENEKSCDRIRIDAMSISASKYIKKWLPFPQQEIDI